MNIAEAFNRCKTLIAEEKMLAEQKAILQSDKFADTVPSVQTVIKDIDEYVEKIPGAIVDTIKSVQIEVPKPVSAPAPAPTVTAVAVNIDPGQVFVNVLKALGVVR